MEIMNQMRIIENVTWRIMLSLVCLMSWIFPESLAAQVNSFSVGDVTGKQGESISLPVFLDNESEIAGGQFRLVLPTGMSVNSVEMETSRAEGHMVDYQWSEADHELSVLFYASPVAVLNGDNGKLCNIRLNVPADYVPGTYSVEFVSDAKLASDAMTLVPVSGLRSGSIHIEEGSETYYTIDVSASVGGYVEGGGTYAEGQEAVLTAVAEDGYEFVKWSDGALDNPYHLIVKENMVIKAEFSPKSYMIIYILDGQIYHTEEIAYGSVVTPLDDPKKEGYVFSGWDNVPETMPAQTVIVNGSMISTPVVSVVRTPLVDVYSRNGVLLKKNVTFSSWYEGLHRGVYIINGKKFITPIF